MSAFLALLRKEMKLEWAARDGLPLALALSLVSLLTLAFVLGPGQASEPPFCATGLWIAVLFGSVLLFGRSLARETESGALQALALSPLDPGTIYLAKTAGAFLAVLGLEAGTLLAAGLFLNAPLGGLGLGGAGALFLGAGGFSSLGVLQAAMAVQTRARDGLLPLLFFPFQIPVLILGGKAVLAALEGGPVEAAWLAALACFDLLFLAAGYLFFGFLMEG